MSDDLKAWAIGAALIAAVLCSVIWATLFYNVQWQRNRCEVTYGANSSTRCLGPTQGEG